MAENQTINPLDKDYFKLVQHQYLFFLFSRQAMFAGYFTVIAVHVSTCYILIANRGFLSSLASFVMLINALLGLLFYVWDKNYRNRIEMLKITGSQLEKSIFSEIIKGNLLFENHVNLENGKINPAGSILILITSIGSLAAAIALFCYITLPYIYRFL